MNKKYKIFKFYFPIASRLAWIFAFQYSTLEELLEIKILLAFSSTISCSPIAYISGIFSRALSSSGKSQSSKSKLSLMSRPPKLYVPVKVINFLV